MTQNEDFNLKLKALHEKLFVLNQYKSKNVLEFLFPDTGTYARSKYPIPLRFFKEGATKRFRMFSGANGSGKSFSCGYEIALHATGLYPHWWEGKRFKKLTTIWIVAESGALFRDSLQKILFGNPGEDIGTGMIPLASNREDGVGIVSTSAIQGIPGGIGTCLVRHKDGHVVSISVKTFDMKREALQAANVGLVVFDEEPPEDVYEECVMRTRGTKTTEPGIVMLAFTPLKGLTNVVLSYLPNGLFPQDGLIPDKPDYFVCRVTWNDTYHLTEADKEAMLSAISPNLRDARTKGIPALGSGRVYPIHEEDIVVNHLRISPDWPRAYGLDFGWQCTAAVWGAKDPATGVIYLYGEYYQGEKAPYVHTHAIKSKGYWIPGVCDPRGDKSSERDGSKLIDEYRSLGLELTPGDNSVQSGVARVLGLMEAGLLKVTYNMEHWLEEFRIYRYDSKDPNKIAKAQKDHLMDATKYLISMFDDVAISAAEVQEQENPRDRRDQMNDRNDITGY